MATPEWHRYIALIVNYDEDPKRLSLREPTAAELSLDAKAVQATKVKGKKGKGVKGPRPEQQEDDLDAPIRPVVEVSYGQPMCNRPDITVFHLPNNPPFSYVASKVGSSPV